MSGWRGIRNYVLIGLLIGGICALVNLIDKDRGLVMFLQRIGSNSASYGLGQTIADFVIKPLELALTEYWGAVLAGFLWPVLLIWFIFFILLLGYMIVAPIFVSVEGL